MNPLLWTNTNRVALETDKHLCKFLLSPFRESGLKWYKIYNNISFAESSKQTTNRLEYLKRLQQGKFVQFAELCQTYGIKPSVKKGNSSDIDLFDNKEQVYSANQASLFDPNKKHFLLNNKMLKTLIVPIWGTPRCAHNNY